MRGFLRMAVVGICISLIFSGCESFRRKFVREKKENEAVKVVVQTYEYESEYSVEELYKRYYIYWRAAQDELLYAIKQDSPHKKQLGAASRVLQNLKFMRQYLVPEKQAELDQYISEQEDILNRLQEHRLSMAQVYRIEQMLEANRRQIEKNFAVRDVQGYLLEQ